MHLAVRYGYIEIVKLLIENGAEINVRNVFKETPLHLALKYTNKNLEEILKERGAKVDNKNEKEIFNKLKNTCKRIFKF
ncbi:MAG: ankyrin repeat domain-containing protein [Bdellovibrionales bacterium]|nr:ankyrin repeat domain-containing protein [Bdellovibrionales bacterium]